MNRISLWLMRKKGLVYKTLHWMCVPYRECINSGWGATVSEWEESLGGCWWVMLLLSVCWPRAPRGPELSGRLALDWVWRSVVMVGKQCYEMGMVDCVIRFDTPAVNAAICSWIYISQVSDDHLPIFLIVLWSTPARCIAIAPPARKLWLPTWSGWRPNCCNPRFFTPCLTAVFISDARTVRSGAVVELK